MCAKEIHKNIDELNRNHNEWQDIHVGIGINTGVMVMGAMGSEDRMDYTILGDNVNLGARLCSHAGAGETVLSESAWNNLDPSAKNEPDFPEIIKGERVQVKGKAEPIQIYRVGV